MAAQVSVTYYLGLDFPAGVRRGFLRDNFGFDCACPRCTPRRGPRAAGLLLGHGLWSAAHGLWLGLRGPRPAVHAMAHGLACRPVPGRGPWAMAMGVGSVYGLL